jgi:uncharacterized membrane-anchored protein YjiN (DUF445 family)
MTLAVPLDAERRAALRRMKTFAAGLLVGAAVLYVVARTWETQPGAPALAGYLRAAAEAGMVGGLADWFAVTALFRHPLGLPIPHTAIIPSRKDQIGQALGNFVGTHFLSEQAVRQRIGSAEITRRLGGWLTRPENAERVANEIATAARAGIGLLRDDDVQPVLEQLIERRLAELHLGPTLGRTLAQIVKDGAHHGAVDLVARSAQQWLLANRDTVITMVLGEAPWWSPKFVDDRVAAKVYDELLRVTTEIVEDPSHRARRAIDAWLARLADDLQHDVEMNERVDRAMAALTQRTELRAAIADIVSAGRKALLDLIDDPESELRVRVRAALVDWGGRLATDENTARKVDDWLQRIAVHVVSNYRDEITRLVTDTVERWDAVDTSRRIELQVGRDLQFIRVNGTLVGAAVGVLIHLFSQLFL